MNFALASANGKPFYWGNSIEVCLWLREKNYPSRILQASFKATLIVTCLTKFASWFLIRLIWRDFVILKVLVSLSVDKLIGS